MGPTVGSIVGSIVGPAVGSVGDIDGINVGCFVGSVGPSVGDDVGIDVGAGVGSIVGFDVIGFEIMSGSDHGQHNVSSHSHLVLLNDHSILVTLDEVIYGQYISISQIDAEVPAQIKSIKLLVYACDGRITLTF